MDNNMRKHVHKWIKSINHDCQKCYLSLQLCNVGDCYLYKCTACDAAYRVKWDKGKSPFLQRIDIKL